MIPAEVCYSPSWWLLFGVRLFPNLVYDYLDDYLEDVYYDDLRFRSVLDDHIYNYKVTYLIILIQFCIHITIHSGHRFNFTISLLSNYTNVPLFPTRIGKFSDSEEAHPPLLHHSTNDNGWLPFLCSLNSRCRRSRCSLNDITPIMLMDSYTSSTVFHTKVPR